MSEAPPPADTATVDKSDKSPAGSSSELSSQSGFGRQISRTGFARQLNRTGHGIFALFLVTLLTAALPPRLMDPAWQIQLSSTLVNNGSLALLGLMLVALASYLNPDQADIKQRLGLLRRLAALAVAGYLLLIPLQGVALWRGIRESSQKITIQRKGLESRLDTIAKVVNESKSAAEIQERLRRLPGAPQIPAEQLAEPLPQLRQRFAAGLERSRARLRATDTKPNADAVQRLLKESLRISLSSLALAFGFAASAGFGGTSSTRSLLDDLQESTGKLLRGPRSGRSNKRSKRSKR
jgi:hypothetical protein